MPMVLFPPFLLSQQRERAIAIEGTRRWFGLDEGATRSAPPPTIGRLCLRPEQVILTAGTDTARIVANGLVNRVDDGIFHQHDVQPLRHPSPSSCCQTSTACSTTAIELTTSFPSLAGAQTATT